MKAIRVRATMASAIVIPHAHEIHLDALLQWVWILRHYPDRLDAIARDVTRTDLIRAHLPVARLRVGDHDVPLCSSWSFPAEARLTTARWTRRKTGEDMSQRARTLSGSSPDRPMFCRGDSVETPWVEWICWTAAGQRQHREVRKALELVRHLGGLRGHGCGEVTSWTVEEADHGPVDTWARAGIAERNLPAEAVEGLTTERLAVEPPYWPPCMQIPAVRAGEPAILRPDIEERLRALA